MKIISLAAVITGVFFMNTPAQAQVFGFKSKDYVEVVSRGPGIPGYSCGVRFPQEGFVTTQYSPRITSIVFDGETGHNITRYGPRTLPTISLEYVCLKDPNRSLRKFSQSNREIEFFRQTQSGDIINVAWISIDRCSRGRYGQCSSGNFRILFTSRGAQLDMSPMYGYGYYNYSRPRIQTQWTQRRY